MTADNNTFIASTIQDRGPPVAADPIRLTPEQHKLFGAEFGYLLKRHDELLAALRFMLGENPTFATSYQEGLEKATAIEARSP